MSEANGSGARPELPDGWRWTTLGEVTHPRRGKVDPKNVPGELYLGLEHVEPHTMRLIGRGAAEDVRSASGRFESGDVLYSRLRPYLNKVLRVHETGICSGEFIVLVPGAEIDAPFLATRLNAPDFVAYTGDLDNGDRPRVKWEQISAFPFLLPSLRADQERIVRVIEAQMARINAGEAQVVLAERLADQLRLSMIGAAVTGRLEKPPTDDEPADALLARALQRRRLAWQEQQLEKMRRKGTTPRDDSWKNRYPEPIAPSPPADIALPRSWTWASVDQLSHLVQYGSSAKTNEDSTGVPVLRMGNILDGTLVFDSLKYLPRDHEEFPELLLRDGDVLFNRTNSPELVGKAAVHRGELDPASFASYLIRVRLDDEVRPEILVYLLTSVLGRRWVRSVVSQQVGQANVNGTKLKALTIPLPPGAAQGRICSAVEDQLYAASNTRRILTATQRQTERLRRAVLHQAFAGQLMAENPADASADDLISAARGTAIQG